MAGQGIVAPASVPAPRITHLAISAQALREGSYYTAHQLPKAHPAHGYWMHYRLGDYQGDVKEDQMPSGLIGYTAAQVKEIRAKR